MRKQFYYDDAIRNLTIRSMTYDDEKKTLDDKPSLTIILAKDNVDVATLIETIPIPFTVFKFDNHIEYQDNDKSGWYPEKRGNFKRTSYIRGIGSFQSPILKIYGNEESLRALGGGPCI